MPTDDFSGIIPQQHTRELVRLLAAGVRRALSGSTSASDSARQKPGQSSENSLEVPADPRLSVHSG